MIYAFRFFFMLSNSTYNRKYYLNPPFNTPNAALSKLASNLKKKRKKKGKDLTNQNKIIVIYLPLTDS